LDILNQFDDLNDRVGDKKRELVRVLSDLYYTEVVKGDDLIKLDILFDSDIGMRNNFGSFTKPI